MCFPPDSDFFASGSHGLGSPHKTEEVVTRKRLPAELFGIVRRRSVGAVIGGTVGTTLAVVCAQPPVGIWWVGCFALTPWILVTRGSAALIVGGAVWGTLSGIAMGYWIFGGLRNLDATRLEALIGLVLVAITVTGLPGALYGAAVALARRFPSGGSLVFAVAVCAIDWTRAIPHLGLPWSLLGHTQASAAGVAQLAVIGGVPMISGLLAGVCYSLAEALTGESRCQSPRRRRTAWLPWLAAYLALLFLGLPVSRALRPTQDADAPVRQILAIQHRIAPDDRWTASLQERNVRLLGEQTLAAVTELERGPDLILWPETSLTVALESASGVASELRSWLARFDAPLVLGGVSPAESRYLYRNTAIWLTKSGDVRDRFHKTLAVPFVERQPSGWLEEALQRAFGARAVRRHVVEGSEHRPLRGDDSYAVALCFEIIYPRLVASRLEADSLAILNLANDAWYGSDTPGVQQLAFARFRAIEHRRYLIRVADSGPSAVVDPFGQIVRELGPQATGSIAAQIQATGGPNNMEQVAIAAVGLLGAMIGLGVRGIAQRS